jgi:hypothetical protein
MKSGLHRSNSNFRIILVILGIILASLACGLGQPKNAPAQPPNTIVVIPTRTQALTRSPVSTKTQAPTRSPESTKTQEPTVMPEPTNTLVDKTGLVHQWASAGEATSENGNSDRSAQHAAGAPDTPSCGDAITAWAAQASDSVESITVYYMEQPLIATAVNIVQNYNPSQVVKVELIDAYSEHYDFIIYEGDPKVVTECPFTLSIPVVGIDYPVMGVRITIDQSVLGLGWNEIDAVELVGYAGPGFEPQPTEPSLPEGIWDNVYALPIFPTAEGVNIVDEDILTYSVSNQTRQEVLDFLLAELESSGWQLDVDESGNCLDVHRCPSKSEDLDYKSGKNELWYFIHLDSPDAQLALTLIEIKGKWSVGMSLK